MRVKPWQYAVTIVLIFLGIFMSVQFRTQEIMASSLEMQRPEDLLSIWRSLKDKQEQLADTLNSLEQESASLSQQSNLSRDSEAKLRRDIELLQMLVGEVPIHGQGITITFTGDSPLIYLDLVDLVNELIVTGVEAVAVNDFRITAMSAIYFREDGTSTYLTVDGKQLLYPIVVKAIGNPATLEKGLTFPGGLIENLATYGITPVIEKRDDLVLPATEQPDWHYAFPASKK